MRLFVETIHGFLINLMKFQIPIILLIFVYWERFIMDIVTNYEPIITLID